MGMVNRTGISASNAGACIGSLVVLLRGAEIQPVHIELVLAETHHGYGWKKPDNGQPENVMGQAERPSELKISVEMWISLAHVTRAWTESIDR